MMRYFLIIGLVLVALLSGCNSDKSENPIVGSLQLQKASVGTVEINFSSSASNVNMPLDKPVVVNFSSPLDISSVAGSVFITKAGASISAAISFLNDDKSISILPTENLKANTTYTLVVTEDLKGKNKETFAGVSIDFKTILVNLTVVTLKMDGDDVTTVSLIKDRSRTGSIELVFSAALKESTVTATIVKISGKNPGTLSFALSDQNKKLTITHTNTLDHLAKYTLTISNSLQGADDEPFSSYSKIFYTAVDPTPKFPLLPNDEDNDNDNTNDLLSVVQRQTFKYFYDFAHPASGMARERNTSGDVVTTGGSGFGLMVLIVGIERGFITRQEGIERFDKILDFLETADRFHGAWSHWINGNTGKVIPFSTKDNGGDLVETSFLAQGLITVRQYLNPADTEENNLIQRINALWESVEWDWYRKSNQNVLYWHWSPTYNWDMNFAMYGYFEEQITYILAAASPTHSIPKVVYSNGYGRNGAIVKNNTYFNIKLPLESPSPLFWVQYSYLGLDPHITDDYANYWEQNVNASLISQAYCVANPKKFIGYSDQNWGLTSSDNQSGYSAHSPNNDLGVITPTAALSSFPYTPVESMKALKFFYYTLGDKLWGPYGFYDAFNSTAGWTASSNLAIDQGPIVVMIENYRTGLLWNLFMSAPEVNDGLSKLNIVH